MIEKSCPQCGKIFHTNNLKKRFCTPRCANNFHSTVVRERKQTMQPPKRMGRPPKVRVCPNCGETFYADRKYCSDECLDEYTFLRSVDPYRAFTHDTVWLVKTWYNNGDSTKLISRVLGRPLSVIEGIIGGEYDEYEREAIKTPISEGYTEDDFDVQEWT